MGIPRSVGGAVTDVKGDSPVGMGSLIAVTPKLDEWLQEIPGVTPEVCVQRNTALGTPKIQWRTPKLFLTGCFDDLNATNFPLLQNLTK